MATKANGIRPDPDGLETNPTERLHNKVDSRGQIWFLSAVSKARSFARYWLPVLIWTAVIYSASADRKSVTHSRIIAPLLRWLFPGIAEETISLVVLVFRKCAHLAEFAILGFLIWRAWRKPVRRDPRPWSWSQAGGTLLCVAVYAGSDEFHQLFVPGRTGSLQDVLIDTLGAAVGLMALWAMGSWRKWWGRPVANAVGAQLDTATRLR